jgi:hypothetical protein
MKDMLKEVVPTISETVSHRIAKGAGRNGVKEKRFKVANSGRYSDEKRER